MDTLKTIDTTRLSDLPAEIELDLSEHADPKAILFQAINGVLAEIRYNSRYELPQPIQAEVLSESNHVYRIRLEKVTDDGYAVNSRRYNR